MERFYYEWCNDDGNDEEEGFFIMENEGGYEHGAHYDIAHFYVQTKEDAIDAVNLLNKLYKKE